MKLLISLLLLAVCVSAQTTATLTPLPRAYSDAAFGKTKLVAYSVVVTTKAPDVKTIPFARILQGTSIAVVPGRMALAVIQANQRRDWKEIALRVVAGGAPIIVGMAAGGVFEGISPKVANGITVGGTVADKGASFLRSQLDLGQVERYQDMACPNVLEVKDGASIPCVVLASGTKAKPITVTLQ